jgi:hypothetical protein
MIPYVFWNYGSLPAADELPPLKRLNSNVRDQLSSRWTPVAIPEALTLSNYP